MSQARPVCEYAKAAQTCRKVIHMTLLYADEVLPLLGSSAPSQGLSTKAKDAGDMAQAFIDMAQRLRDLNAGIDRALKRMNEAEAPREVGRCFCLEFTRGGTLLTVARNIFPNVCSFH
jgi:hypothetical protein